MPLAVMPLRPSFIRPTLRPPFVFGEMVIFEEDRQEMLWLSRIWLTRVSFVIILPTCLTPSGCSVPIGLQ